MHYLVSDMTGGIVFKNWSRGFLQIEKFLNFEFSTQILEKFYFEPGYYQNQTKNPPKTSKNISNFEPTNWGFIEIVSIKTHIQH